MYVRFKWIIWYSWLYISICAIIPTLSYLFIYIICIYVVYILIIHVAVSPPDYRFMDQSTNHDGLDFRLSHMSLIPPIFISTIIILAWQNKYLLIPLYSHYIYIYIFKYPCSTGGWLHGPRIPWTSCGRHRSSYLSDNSGGCAQMGCSEKAAENEWEMMKMWCVPNTNIIYYIYI
jgi:hypothetical protein